MRPNQLDVNGKKDGDWVYYYDEEWNTLDKGTKAVFYRLITYENGKPNGQVIDYFRNGNKQMSIDLVINEDPLQYEGMLSEYSKEANLVLVEYMKNVQMDSGLNWRLDSNKLNSEVFVMNVDGSNLINISNSKAFDGWPFWMSDYKTVIFTSNRGGKKNMGQLYSVNINEIICQGLQI